MKIGKPYNANDAWHDDFPKFGRRSVHIGLGSWALVVSDRALVSCYKHASIQSHKVSVAVLKLNFGFPNTNHPCIWYRLAAICDASFDWGLPTPSLGKSVVVWGRRWVPWVARIRVPIGSRHTTCKYRQVYLSPFTQCSGCSRQTDGWTDGRNWSSKRRHMHCIGRQKQAVSYMQRISNSEVQTSDVNVIGLLCKITWRMK